jgi:hypothetical protein
MSANERNRLRVGPEKVRSFGESDVAEVQWNCQARVMFMRTTLCVGLVAILSGCVPSDRAFREVEGPAHLSIMSPWGVSMSVDIEEDGRYFSGPEYDAVELYGGDDDDE